MTDEQKKQLRAKQDKFVVDLKELWEKSEIQGDCEFVVGVVAYDENHKSLDMQVSGFGCPCCIIEQMFSLMVVGELVHSRDELNIPSIEDIDIPKNAVKH